MLIGLLKSLLYMFLFFFLLRVLGYIFKFIYFLVNKRFTNRENSGNTDSNQSYALKMLQCEKCKVYVAKSEAYVLNGRIFCKKEHSS